MNMLGSSIKYGVIDYTEGYDYLGEESTLNVGDDIQSIAIEALYKKIGIAEEQIIKIPHRELKEYCKETVVLPLNMFGTKGDIFPISSFIIPIFIGFHYLSGRVSDKKNFFKRFAPIGCRDEYTLNIFREEGLDCYLSGCMTLTLEKRENVGFRNKIFLVDVEETIKEKIPLEGDIEFVSHEFKMTSANFERHYKKNTYQFARHLLNRYRDEAKLVVTSRLHCAAPCIAMGIPVVLIKENIEPNLSWIDKLLKVYTYDEIDLIDWNSSPANFDEIKSEMLTNFKNVLLGQDSRVAQRHITEYFLDRDRSDYAGLIKKRISKIDIFRTFKDKRFNYAICGVGAGGVVAYLAIKDIFPEAKHIKSYDKYESGSFFGVDVECEIRDREAVDFYFIATYSGAEYWSRVLMGMGLSEGKDWAFSFYKTPNK